MMELYFYIVYVEVETLERVLSIRFIVYIGAYSLRCNIKLIQIVYNNAHISMHYKQKNTEYKKSPLLVSYYTGLIVICSRSMAIYAC